MNDTSTRVWHVTARSGTIPTDVPEGDGTLTWDSTTIVVVHVSDGYRWGTGWTYGPGAVASVVTDVLAAEVTGRPVMDIAGCWAAMVAAVRNAGRAGICGLAISAIDVALWDLKAKILAISVSQLLGAVRSWVPVYASGGFTTYNDEQLTDQLNRWVHQGHTAVKIKVGGPSVGSWHHDVNRVLLARHVIGNSIELFVDGNGAYSVAEAVRFARAVEPATVTWFEEPVTSDDLDGLGLVRLSIDADVTAGEYGFDEVYFRRMCAAGAVDCLQIDATRCGGYTGWLAAANIAWSHCLDVSAHCAPYLHAPVCAATARARHIEWFHDHARIEQALFAAPDPHAGSLHAGELPGIGLELDENQWRRWTGQ